MADGGRTAPDGGSGAEKGWELLACVVLGHLCFLPVFDLVAGGTPRLFLLHPATGSAAIGPLLVLASVVTCAGALSFQLRRRGHALAANLIWFPLVFLGASILCRIFIYDFFNAFFPKWSTGRVKMLIMGLWMAGVGAFVVIQGPVRWVLATRRILVILAPLVVMIWWRAGLHRVRRHDAFKAPAAVTAPKGAGRLWVLVFDELDGELVVDGHVLTEFDQWRAFSFCAVRAYPPTGGTLWSIPALLQGRQITEEAHDTDYLNSWQTLEEASRTRNWVWSDNLFRDVQARGGRASVLGWGAFPYPEFYASTIGDLHFLAGRQEAGAGSLDLSFRSTLKIIILEAVAGPFIAARSSADPAATTALVLDELHASLAQVAGAPRPGLVWIHYPIPHFPSVKPGGTYLDNLRRVDVELRHFRELLQAGGIWEASTLIVTADHWYRKPGADHASGYDYFIRGTENRWNRKDHRVPFLVKFPHQKEPFVHQGGFNTILLRKMVDGMASGEVDTPGKLSTWLDANTPYAESPTTLTLP